MIQNDRQLGLMAHRMRRELAELGVKLAEKTGYGIVPSGLVVSQQSTPDMTVKVSAGVRYKADGTRQAVGAVLIQEISPADDTYDRLDTICLDTNGVFTYLVGNVQIDAVAGSRSYTVSTNAVVDDTVTIGGEVFTAVAADAGTDEFVPGATAAACATALAAVFGANAVLSALYTVTNPSAGVVLLTETTPGGLDTPSVAEVTGTVEITSGTATASVAYADGGTAPSVPAGGINLAEINVDANQTVVETADITDKRVWDTHSVT